jgi:hypothetical protein
MTNLSPAAQAILDALYMDELNGPQQLMARAHASAALRALAVRIRGAKGSLIPTALSTDLCPGARGD